MAGRGSSRGRGRGAVRDWTGAAAWRVLLWSLSWAAFFLLVCAIEFLVAAIQTRMSTVLYIDAVALLLLSLAYFVEAGLTYPLVRHIASGADIPPGEQLVPLQVRVLWPGVARHIMGRITVLLVGPVFFVLWISSVFKKTSNYSVDGFVMCVLIVHLCVLLWEGIGAFVWSWCGKLRVERACSNGTERMLVVLSLNATQWRGSDGVVDVGRAVEMIQAHKPDVVALQDTGPAGEEHTLLQQVAEALRMSVVSVPSFVLDASGHRTPSSNAVLVSSQWEVANFDHVQLQSWRRRSSTAWGKPHPTSALVAQVRAAGVSPANSMPITVVCTQFGSDSDGVEQVLSVVELAHALRQSSSAGLASSASSASLVTQQVLPTRLVVCGDMRVTSTSWCMQYAEALGLVDSAQSGFAGLLGCGCASSSPGPLPILRGDRILVNATGSVRVANTYVGSSNDETTLHHAVVARVAYPIRAERSARRAR